MSKMLEITNCKDCPNCEYVDSWDYYYCVYHVGDVIPEPDAIPDWCPLPNKEDK